SPRTLIITPSPLLVCFDLDLEGHSRDSSAKRGGTSEVYTTRRNIHFSVAELKLLFSTLLAWGAFYRHHQELLSNLSGITRDMQHRGQSEAKAKAKRERSA